MRAPPASVYNPVFARAASRNLLTNSESTPLDSASYQLNQDPGLSSSKMPGEWIDLDEEEDKERPETRVSVMQPSQTDQQTGLGATAYNYDPFSMDFGQPMAPVYLANSQTIPPPPPAGFPSSSSALTNSWDDFASFDPYMDSFESAIWEPAGRGLTGNLTGNMNRHLNPTLGPSSGSVFGYTGLNPSPLSTVGHKTDMIPGSSDSQRPSLAPNAPLLTPATLPVAGPHGLPGFPTSSAAAAYYDYVTNDPTKTRDEIKSLLENIRPDMELPPENREGTPEAMKYPLMEHQKLGLTWLKKMEEGSNKGGILADDMGLGKTIQALALLVSKPSKDPRRKTTLIVAPVALLKQWEREIATKIKSTHRLSTFVAHGTGRLAKWSTLREFDVVLTTFGTLASELKKSESWDSKRRTDPDLSSANAPNLPLLGNDSKWYR